jgi:hypothetical protein
MEAPLSGRTTVAFLPSTTAILAAPAIWSDFDEAAIWFSPGIAPFTSMTLAPATPAEIPNAMTYSMSSTIPISAS